MRSKGQNLFPKTEKISNKKVIKKLFDDGNRIKSSFFDIRIISGLEGEINQVLITASKNKIKSAVKRNLIKRRIRESYRINKHLIKKKGLKIGIIYSETKIMNFQEINKSLGYIIRKINSND